MTEHNNPGPPERCYDDCPMNHTGNSEDCTCAGTMLDSNAALFARQRDDAQAIVLAVSRILGISHLADGLEHGRVTSAVRSWMDTAAQLTRERDSAATEAGRVREELADVRASREAWVLEADRLDVIATAAEYHTGPEECCDSECDHLHDDEGNFIGTDGEWCPHVEMRHATAEDAIEANKVPLLEARIETLDREAAEDSQFRDSVAAALKISPILSNAGLVSATERLTRELAEVRRMRDLLAEEADELREAGHRVAGMFNADPENHQISGVLHNIVGQLIAWRTDPAQVPDGWRSLVRKGWSVGARPAIPADAEEGTFGQRCEELGRIPAGRYYLTSGVEVGDNREVVSRFDIPGGVRIAGFWPSHKARIEPAPVSGSDTTEDGGDR